MMNTNYFSLIAIGVLLWGTFSSCESKKKDGYVIEGEVPAQGTVVLYQYKDRAYTAVDTVAITDGHFHFEGSVAEPLVYALRLNGTGARAHLYLENEKVNVSLSPEGKLTHLSGSEQARTFEHYSQLNAQEALNLEEELKANPSSPALAYFLARRAYLYDYPRLVELRGEVSTELADNPYLKELDGAIAHLSAIQPGVLAPEISVEGLNGEVVTLSSLRGQTVIVDFWASWCPDCRKASPELVRIYNTYKDKGLTLLSVSFDQEQEAWRKAIEKDGLGAWHHGIAPEGWFSPVGITYALRWIPTSVLIDPDGRIVARSIHVEELVPMMNFQ